MFKRAKNRNKELLNNYSKVKEELFNFDLIKRYSSQNPKTDGFRISELTFSDLGFDELFMFLDRSCSKIGQQYLYSVFQIIPKDNSDILKREKFIQQISKDIPLKEECVLTLSKLNNHEDQYITSLFQEEYLEKPNWFWLVKLSAILSLGTVITAIFIPAFWIVFIFILIGNYIIHYWNKKNLFQYGTSLPQLLALVRAAKIISSLTGDNSEETKIAIADLGKLKFAISCFKLNPSANSDFGEIGEYILELFKAFFLIEPILLFRILQKLAHQKDKIHHLYRMVGELDLCLNINSVRGTLASHCQLTRLENGIGLKMSDGYHPLIIDPVSNTIAAEDQSILLTGSNMSGKSTFIRTLGINAIIGQSLNICFAESFQMPPLNVFSAIQIADDLMNNRSYYFQEVSTIKELLVASDSGKPNLFLLDELFKGTNTIERIASGKAVLTRLAQNGNITFIATHDLELSQLLKNEYETYHFSEQIQENEIIFDYKLKVGGLQKTNAIKILEVNGFPAEVIEEAKRIVQILKN